MKVFWDEKKYKIVITFSLENIITHFILDFFLVVLFFFLSPNSDFLPKAHGRKMKIWIENRIERSEDVQKEFQKQYKYF